MTEITNDLYQTLSNYIPLVKWVNDTFEIDSLLELGCGGSADFGYSTNGKEAWDQMKAWSCENNGFLCDDSDEEPLEKALGIDIGNLPLDVIIRGLKHFPAGAAVKSVIHYGQNINGVNDQPAFRKYDYGPFKNCDYYGRKSLLSCNSPPDYDFGTWKVPLTTIWMANDSLAPEASRCEMFKRLSDEGLQNCDTYTIPDWTHDAGIVVPPGEEDKINDIWKDMFVTRSRSPCIRTPDFCTGN